MCKKSWLFTSSIVTSPLQNNYQKIFFYLGPYTHSSTVRKCVFSIINRNYINISRIWVSRTSIISKTYFCLQCRQVTRDDVKVREETADKTRRRLLYSQQTISFAARSKTLIKWRLQSWFSFTDSRGMEDWVGLGTMSASRPTQSVQDRYRATWRISQLLAIYTATPHWASGCTQLAHTGIRTDQLLYDKFDFTADLTGTGNQSEVVIK